MTNVFEESAQEYDEWFIQNLSVYESEIRAVKELAPPSGKGLEIGVGTGLDLSVINRIVIDHQGTIKVESTPGEGSTFTVQLLKL